jgi:hypothetical protein
LKLNCLWNFPVKVSAICASAAVIVDILAFPVSVEAAGATIRGRFSYDGIANCQQPAIRNFPIHAEGTAVLSTDRKASLDMTSNTGGRSRLNATLGGKPVEAPGGSTSLNVIGSHTLRAVRDYPNNVAIVTMTIRGSSCTMTLDNRLKPGKKVYTFVSGSGSVSYCARPQITRTECVSF